MCSSSRVSLVYSIDSMCWKNRRSDGIFSSLSSFHPTHVSPPLSALEAAALKEAGQEVPLIPNPIPHPTTTHHSPPPPAISTYQKYRLPWKIKKKERIYILISRASYKYIAGAPITHRKAAAAFTTAAPLVVISAERRRRRD